MVFPQIAGVLMLLAFIAVFIAVIAIAIHMSTLIKLTRYQNEILKNIFKQNGGKIIDEVTGKEE